MRKIHFIVLVIALFGAMLITIAVIQTKANSPASQDKRNANSEKPPITDEIFYGETLVLLAKLKNIDDYRRLAGLTDDEADRLLRLAENCAAEIQRQDAVAQQWIIANKQVSKPTTKPPMSAPAILPNPLAELQRQRDQIVLKYRDRTRSELGEDKFQRFRKAAESLVNITISSFAP